MAGQWGPGFWHRVCVARHCRMVDLIFTALSNWTLSRDTRTQKNKASTRKRELYVRYT